MINIAEVKAGDFLSTKEDIHDSLIRTKPLYKKDKRYCILKVYVNAPFKLLTLHNEKEITTKWFSQTYSGKDYYFMSKQELRKEKIESIWS